MFFLILVGIFCCDFTAAAASAVAGALFVTCAAVAARFALCNGLSLGGAGGFFWGALLGCWVDLLNKKGFAFFVVIFRAESI